MAVALAFGSLALVLYGTSSISSKYGVEDEGMEGYMRDEYPMMYSRHC